MVNDDAAYLTDTLTRWVGGSGGSGGARFRTRFRVRARWRARVRFKPKPGLAMTQPTYWSLTSSRTGMSCGGRAWRCLAVLGKARWRLAVRTRACSFPPLLPPQPQLPSSGAAHACACLCVLPPPRACVSSTAEGGLHTLHPLAAAP